MPTEFKTTFATGQDNYSLRNGGVSAREAQQPLRIMKVSYTAAGTEATNDYIDLGAMGLVGELIPELSRVVNTGSGDADFTFALQKIPADGSAAVGLATGSVDNDSSALTRAATLENVGREDRLRVLLTVNTGGGDALEADEVLTFYLAFACPQR